MSLDTIDGHGSVMVAAAAALKPSRRGGTGEGGTGEGGFEGCARRKHKRRLAAFVRGEKCSSM
jgi:hypothetical protein